MGLSLQTWRLVQRGKEIREGVPAGTYTSKIPISQQQASQILAPQISAQQKAAPPGTTQIVGTQAVRQPVTVETTSATGEKIYITSTLPGGAQPGAKIVATTAQTAPTLYGATKYDPTPKFSTPLQISPTGQILPPTSQQIAQYTGEKVISTQFQAQQIAQKAAQQFQTEAIAKQQVQQPSTAQLMYGIPTTISGVAAQSAFQRGMSQDQIAEKKPTFYERVLGFAESQKKVGGKQAFLVKEAIQKKEYGTAALLATKAYGRAAVYAGAQLISPGVKLVTQPITSIKGTGEFLFAAVTKPVKTATAIKQQAQENPEEFFLQTAGSFILPTKIVRGAFKGVTAVKEAKGVLDFKAKGFVSPEQAAGAGRGEVSYPGLPFRSVKVREVSVQRAEGGVSKILIEKPGITGKKVYEVTVQRAPEGTAAYQIRKVTSSTKDLTLKVGGAPAYQTGGVIKEGVISKPGVKITPRVIKQSLSPVIERVKDFGEYSAEAPRSILAFEQTAVQQLKGKTFPYRKVSARRAEITTGKIKMDVQTRMAGRVEATPQITTVTTPEGVAKFIEKPEIVIAKEEAPLADFLEIKKPTISEIRLKSTTPEAATKELKERVVKISKGVEKIEVLQPRKAALIKQVGGEGRFEYTVRERKKRIPTRIEKELARTTKKMFRSKKAEAGTVQELAPSLLETVPETQVRERPIVKVRVGDVRQKFVTPQFSSRDFPLLEKEIVGLQKKPSLITISPPRVSNVPLIGQDVGTEQPQVQPQKIEQIPDLKKRIEQAQKSFQKEQQKAEVAVKQQQKQAQKMIQQQQQATAQVQAQVQMTTPLLTTPVSVPTPPPMAFQVPMVVPPPAFFIPGSMPSGGQRTFRPPMRRVSGRKGRYTPTGFAAFFDVKGSESAGLTETGFSFRPVTGRGRVMKRVSPKKKRRSRKR